jgi:hypothetical protein
MKTLLFAGVFLSSLGVLGATQLEKVGLQIVPKDSLAIVRRSNAVVMAQPQSQLMVPAEETLDLSSRINLRQVRNPLRIGNHGAGIDWRLYPSG